MGILPDKFILLRVKYSAAIARMKNNLIQVNQSLYGNELEDLAANTYKEYELNMKGVREVFHQFIFEHGAEDKTSSDVTAELKKMLDLRFKNDAPRRPPRILIMGPPGSGRSTQAKLMADQFGLIFLSCRELLKDQI